MPEAESLIRSIFRSMSLFERLSFVVIRSPESITGRLVMFLGGVKGKVAFDVYVDEEENVVGTTGLYRYNRDYDEAVWVAWFCVDPKARGRRIGQALIEHTVARARDAGDKLIRLYTSTDPNEAAAQHLYEKNGFVEIGRKTGLFGTMIFREKKIEQAEKPVATDD
jgi:ribosomal protein S18 acetylase RimI-like enzyme